MKTLIYISTLIALGGCSLVLEDPAPFIVTDDAAIETDAEPDAESTLDDAFVPNDAQMVDFPDARPPADAEVNDAIVSNDAQPDAQPGPDAMVVEDAQPVPDARVVEDAQPEPDAEPDAMPMGDAMPPECFPQDERCNGEDDDCDGEVDEDDPSICVPCGIGDATGMCGFGAFDCVEGELICQRWLPPSAAGVPCDLIDNDCDGEIDEGEEISPERTPEEGALFTRCGPNPRSTVELPEPPCNIEPRIVGCDLAHACVPADCRGRCETSRTATFAPCFAQCPDEPELARANCIGACREAVEGAHIACLEACNNDAEARFTCEDGPICAPAD
ncbi:MAG: hypothetical protein ACE366_03540 [Bradymonadia bacterium]